MPWSRWSLITWIKSTLSFTNYLDNFLFGGHPSLEACGRVWDLALHLYQAVGFPIMREEVLGLSTVLNFLGFIIDTMSMEIRLLLRNCHALSRWFILGDQRKIVQSILFSLWLTTCSMQAWWWSQVIPSYAVWLTFRNIESIWKVICSLMQGFKQIFRGGQCFLIPGKWNRVSVISALVALQLTPG